MLKRGVQKGVERLVRGWLLDLRRHPRTTHLDPEYAGRYFWNERDYQWALLSHMKHKAGTAGFGSKWSIHAEGTWDRPRYAHKSRWKVRKRSDIVVVDHAGLLRWVKDGCPGEADFPMEAAIELKLTYGHTAATRRLIQADVRKLHEIVRDGMSKTGYLVWLDNVWSNGEWKGSPFFAPAEIREMRRGTRVKVFHWPDGSGPVVTETGTARIRDEIRNAPIHLYP